jgi:excisionase family DNA binding protein
MANELLSVEEAGQRLGVSRATVWRMLQKRMLPSVREHGRRWIPASALMRHPRRRAPEVAPFTAKHPIFRLVGVGRGGGQKPGARDKHPLLAPASKRGGRAVGTVGQVGAGGCVVTVRAAR